MSTLLLLPYHLRLAARSLRRDPVISALMLLALAMGAGVWSIAVTQYTRFYSFRIQLDPALHHVEVLRPHDKSSAIITEGAVTDLMLAPISLIARTQVSYPEYRLLAGSAIPRREAAGIRSDVLVRAPSGAGGVRIARFTNADFFSMFAQKLAAGAAWGRAEDAGGAGVVVLGAGCAETLFPDGGAVGQTVIIDERPFRVAGVLAAAPPLNAPWQMLLTGGQQDALFLPIGELNRLSARPEAPFYQSPVGTGRDDLMASDALYVSFWVDLPTTEARARYLVHLERSLGPGRYRLRSLAEWRRDFPVPGTQISFFGFLGAVVLLSGGFNLSRWLLTKGLSRSSELGVYRALGAPRSALFWRILAEAGLVSLGAALLSPAFALPMIGLFNHLVHIVDLPLVMDRSALALTVIPTFLVGIAGAIYPAWRLARTPPTLYLVGP